MSHTVTHNTAEQQFEVLLPNGEKASIVYRFYKQDIAFMHTEVPAEFEGQGIAASMAKAALAWARAEGKKIMLYCPYMSAYVKRHPEYHNLVDRAYHQGF